MPTDNEWLRLLYVQLTQSGTAGASINQSQVRAAIESAANLDSLEPLLAILSDAVDQTNDVFNSRDSWRSLTLTPASGSYTATSSGFTQTVPVGKEWQFQSAYLPYNTDATVLNRVMRAYFGVSSGGFAGVSVSRVAQTASLNRIYNIGLYPSLDMAVDNQYVYLPLPPLILAAGDLFGVTVPSKPAGDAFTNPIVKVMERSL